MQLVAPPLLLVVAIAEILRQHRFGAATKRANFFHSFILHHFDEWLGAEICKNRFLKMWAEKSGGRALSVGGGGLIFCKSNPRSRHV
jgi:hypothetical protein